jgi:starch synthase (maltosyl-transferring)
MSEARSSSRTAPRRGGTLAGTRPEPQARTGCDALPSEGRIRAVIEAVSPSVDHGRFAIKRVQGDRVEVTADCFTDGHDALMCLLRWRHDSEAHWHEAPMRAEVNDRWRGEFCVERLGRYRYTVTAWVDAFLSWRHDFARRIEPEDIRSAALAGAELIEQAARRARDDASGNSPHPRSLSRGEREDNPRSDPGRGTAASADVSAASSPSAGGERGELSTASRPGADGGSADLSTASQVSAGGGSAPLPSPSERGVGGEEASAPDADAERLHAWAEQLRGESDIDRLRALALDADLAELALRHPDRRFEATWPHELAVIVDRPRARFSTWYELFPRSTGEEGRHGTFDDVIARLPYVAGMGFDVLYLPPIHPIGRERRKGRNNTLAAGPDDVGSPWAIGAAEGGHTAVHGELGTLEDFKRLVAAARQHGLEIALDLAYQCAPDHPYVESHPQWFRHRPDGSVQYAENPPKKYQDIYPFNFESDDWAGLWKELRHVIAFWLEQGVRIFRVDNPHTKAFAFWEWAIADAKRVCPDAIFLAEAFTRPKVMHRLAKLGFTQSYTYFAWRNTRQELTEYFTELAHGPGREYFRPNVWPNTPDILTEYLQFGGRAAFMARAVLAATLAASYGIYGPAFELMEHAPREPGSEEYLDSEKYQIRLWDLGREDSLAELIGRLNRARRDNPALQSDWSLTFHDIDNDAMICYSKSEGDNVVLAIVNLDPYHVQSGWTQLDLDVLGLDASAPYQMHELISGARYLWQGARNFVSLDPGRVPAHVFRLRRRVRTERDFDYFL